MRNVFMDEQPDPATMDISVFSITLYGQISGMSSEVATEPSILVSWVADESQGKPAIPVFCLL